MRRASLIMPLLIVVALCVLSCSRGLIGPTKEIEVPSGGLPVLTATEQAAQEYDRTKRVTGPVALATFESTTSELDAPPMKPLARWTEQEVAAEALGRIGPSAVPDLIDATASPDATVRLKAVEVLGRMGEDAQEAVPRLMPLLDDRDPAVRKAAARTLGRIGPAAKDAVPALMRTLLEPPPKPVGPAP